MILSLEPNCLRWRRSATRSPITSKIIWRAGKGTRGVARCQGCHERGRQDPTLSRGAMTRSSTALPTGAPRVRTRRASLRPSAAPPRTYSNAKRTTR
jgi:hypothetical protein